jgi:hypothetical protein
MTVGKTTNNLNIGYEKTVYGSFNPNDNFKNGNILKLSASVSSGGAIFNNINFKINKILSNDDLSAFKQIIWNSVTYPRNSFSYETNISDSYTQFTYSQQSNLPFNFSTFILLSFSFINFFIIFFLSNLVDLAITIGISIIDFQ